MNKQRYITAGVTIAAAAVTAHLMQSDSGEPNTAPALSAASAASVVGPAAAPSARLPNDVTLIAVEPSEVPTGSAEAPAVAMPNAPVETPPVETPMETDITGVDPATSDLPNAAGSVLPADLALSPPDASQPEMETELASLVDPASPETLPSVPALPVLPADIAAVAPLPEAPTTLSDRLSALDDEMEIPRVDETERSEFGLSCEPFLSATVQDQGLVSLTLTAPCQGDSRLTVRHGVLEFSGLTDKLGSYQVRIPALSADAEFTVTIADGTEITAFADVPRVNELERVALVGAGDSGLQIHALEFGATYGEQGHIWADSPGDPILAATNGGGYLIRLGDTTLEDPMITEVYTFPGDTIGQTGVVRLSVEAEVTAGNCATEVTGWIVEPGLDGLPKPMSMAVAVPDCDAVGEFLVLKNLLRDLRIASN